MSPSCSDYSLAALRGGPYRVGRANGIFTSQKAAIFLLYSEFTMKIGQTLLDIWYVILISSIFGFKQNVFLFRLQLSKDNLNARSAFHSILVNDGVKGLFRGCLLRTLRRTLMASLAWTVYEQVVVNLGLR